MGIPAEIYHIVNRLRYCSVKHRHKQDAKKIEYRRHQNCRLRRHGPCGNTGGDSIWRIGPAIDQNNPQSKGYRNCQRWIRSQLTEKFIERACQSKAPL